jgi:protein-S-isoprenylcysteine O-methyltransferase Ste14
MIRIRGEELLLARELEGYEAYREEVRYRLFPGIW